MNYASGAIMELEESVVIFNIYKLKVLKDGKKYY